MLRSKISFPSSRFQKINDMEFSWSQSIILYARKQFLFASFNRNKNMLLVWAARPVFHAGFLCQF